MLTFEDEFGFEEELRGKTAAVDAINAIRRGDTAEAITILEREFLPRGGLRSGLSGGDGKMKIKIERLTDTHDCETCGPSWAEGAHVYFDDELVLELEPHAHCYDGDDYSGDKIFAAILEKLGHTLTYADVD